MSQETAPPADAPARKPKKALLLVAVIVVGLAGGGAAGAFMAGPLLAGKVPAAAAAGDSAHADGDEAGADGAGKDGEQGGGDVVLVDNVVLNPAQSGGQRFLLVSIGIAVKDAKIAEAMKARDPELRDAILRYLGAMQVEELSDVARRDSLKLGVKAAVAERFGKGSVRDVYFPQFVIQ